MSLFITSKTEEQLMKNHSVDLFFASDHCSLRSVKITNLMAYS